MGSILVMAATIAALVTGLSMPVATGVEIARVLFVVFLVALIAAGVRSMVRAARRHV